MLTQNLLILTRKPGDRLSARRVLAACLLLTAAFATQTLGEEPAAPATPPPAEPAKPAAGDAAPPTTNTPPAKPATKPTDPTAVKPASLPPDLVGKLAGMKRVWALDGCAPGGTTLGYEGEKGPELLVGGRRLTANPARLGDVSEVSLNGIARRRVVADASLRGLPAMVSRVAIAADASGQLNLWTMTRTGAECNPRNVKLGGEPLAGPVALGKTILVAAGAQVETYNNLFSPGWHTDLGAAITEPLATDRDHVFAATDAKLTALNLADGKVAWSQPLPEPSQTSLRVSGGLVMAGLSDGNFYAWDSETGAPAWTAQLLPAVFCEEPALAGPWIIVTTADGRILGLNIDDGKIMWRQQAAGPLSSPVVGYGHVFVCTGDGALDAVPFAADAAVIELTTVNASGQKMPLHAAPSLIDDRAYVVSDSGVLLAVQLEGAEGPVEWAVVGGNPQRCGRTLPPDEVPTLEDQTQEKESAKPADGAKPAEPAKPGDGAKQAEPAKPTDGAKPAEPAIPVEPAKPSEPSKPTPTAPATPAKPANAAPAG